MFFFSDIQNTHKKDIVKMQSVEHLSVNSQDNQSKVHLDQYCSHHYKITIIRFVSLKQIQQIIFLK